MRWPSILALVVSVSPAIAQMGGGISNPGGSGSTGSSGGGSNAGYLSSNYYASPLSGGIAAGAALTLGFVYCHPFQVGYNGLTFKQFAVDVTIAENGQQVSFAIYNSGSNGFPNSKVADIGTVGTNIGAGTGTLPATPAASPVALAPGMYWPCFTSNTAGTLRVNSLAIFRLIDMVVGDTTATSTAVIGQIGVGSGRFNGIVCSAIAAGTCAGANTGGFVWSGVNFTWASTLAGTNWMTAGPPASPSTVVGGMPAIALQAN